MSEPAAQPVGRMSEARHDKQPAAGDRPARHVREALRRITERLASGFRVSKLKNRFLVVMIGLGFIPMAVVGIASFRISSRTIEKNHVASYSSNLYSFSSSIDLVLQNAVRDSRQVLAHPAVQAELAPTRTTGRPAGAFDIGTVQVFDEVSRTITISNKNISSIWLFDTQGRSYTYSRATISGGSGAAPLVPDGQQEYWLRTARAAGGREVFLGWSVLAPDGDDNVISCVKVLKSINDFRTIGLLVLMVSKDFLWRQVPHSETTEGVGRYVIAGRDEDSWRTVFESVPTEPASGDLRELIAAVGDGQPRAIRTRDDLVTWHRNEMTGWRIIHRIGLDVLLRDVEYIRVWTVGISLAMLAIVAILFGIVSGMLSRPLTQLESVIASVADGERTITEEFGNDEIGQIGNQFKNLVNTNIDLKERLITATLRQREAELSALQAQINPHFLYNTLDSIFWIAKASKVDAIADLTLALSKVFKRSLNDGDDHTTVAREIDHIESYLAIQLHRHRDRFTVSLEIDERILGREMLNLTLQPFVENAIRHGLEPKVGPGYVSVTGHEHEGMLEFVVEDDGVGLPDSFDPAGGFAVSNVRERLAIHYGSSTSVTLSDRAAGGTRVLIRFPSRRPTLAPDGSAV